MKQVWQNLARENSLRGGFFTENLHEWMDTNLKAGYFCRGLAWLIIFGTTISLAWQARNEFVFQQAKQNSDQLTIRIKAQSDYTCQSIRHHKQVVPGGVSSMESREIRWRHPDPGWHKINCDGAVVELGSRAGCGGVIHNDEGGFFAGFATPLGPCSVTEAKLWGILRGLQLARARGLDKIMVETDSMAAVRLIRMDCSPIHPNISLIKEIQDLMNPKKFCRIDHVMREANKVADDFAKHGLLMSLDSSICIFENIPLFVDGAFGADCTGTVFPRGS